MYGAHYLNICHFGSRSRLSPERVRSKLLAMDSAISRQRCASHLSLGCDQMRTGNQLSKWQRRKACLKLQAARDKWLRCWKSATRFCKKTTSAPLQTQPLSASSRSWTPFRPQCSASSIVYSRSCTMLTSVEILAVRGLNANGVWEVLRPELDQYTHAARFDQRRQPSNPIPTCIAHTLLHFGGIYEARNIALQNWSTYLFKARNVPDFRSLPSSDWHALHSSFDAGLHARFGSLECSERDLRFDMFELVYISEGRLARRVYVVLAPYSSWFHGKVIRVSNVHRWTTHQRCHLWRNGKLHSYIEGGCW